MMQSMSRYAESQNVTFPDPFQAFIRVWRCSLAVSKPVLKAPLVSALGGRYKFAASKPVLEAPKHAFSAGNQ
jgi:hypothetical protein